MHRPDRNFVYTLAAHRLEGERRAIIVEFLWRDGVFPEREIVFGPESVAHQLAGIGVVYGFDTEQIFDLSLEARGGVIEGRHRVDRRVFAVAFSSRARTSSRGR